MDNNYKHRNYICLISKALRVIKSVGNRQTDLISLWIIRIQLFHTLIPMVKQIAAKLTGASWCTDPAYNTRPSHRCVPCTLTPFQDPAPSLGANSMTVPESGPVFHHQSWHNDLWSPQWNRKQRSCVPDPKPYMPPSATCYFCHDRHWGFKFLIFLFWPCS